MIVKSVFLACPPDRAFALVTERAGEWWPVNRRHTDDDASTIRMEAAGRFFERARDGTEVELGVVKAFEPAQRVVLDWYPGTGENEPTQVVITFEAIDEGTRVTVTHGAGEARLDRFAENVAAYGTSWDLVLSALYAA